MQIEKNMGILQNKAIKRYAVKRFIPFGAGLCLGFFQTVLFIPDTCAQDAPQASGPIDIQANEQEFAESMVLAKGNVVVTYKDSIVKSPEAKLFRDPNGQPQKAIFSGHPYLTQNDNKITADTLIFEINDSKFIAQGNAHSEVSSEGDSNVDLKATPDQAKPAVKKESKGPRSAVTAKKNGEQPFAWPHASDDQSAFEKPTPKASTNANSSAGNKASRVESKSTSAKASPGTKSSPGAGEKIVTDSDYQEYSKDSGKFDATGHVHVVHGEISVFADKLKLVYGTDGKPETALFTGHVNAFQGANNTQAEIVTYYLATKRLQATGNVRSRMIQQKGDASKENATKKTIGMQGSRGGATAAPNSSIAMSNEDPVIVVSDAQDINQNTGKMSAEGNVKVYYQDMMGAGPKVLLLRNADGRAEKVIFTERSQISQPGKRWIADRITMSVQNKKVLAEGNTKAYIIGNPSRPAIHQDTGTLASRPSNKNITNGSADKKTTAVAGNNKNGIY